MARKYKKSGVEVTTALDKTKKYKYDSTGDLVESTGTPTANEIVFSGSKSSLRRMADAERNISILATTLMTTDGTADDGNNSSFGSNVDKKTRFKKEVRMDTALNMKAGIDMNTNKITEVGTPTATTDAANKAYVDAREAAAEASAATDATTKANAAISTAATDATTKANAAQAAAISAVTNGAGAAYDTLVEIQNAMATDAELSSAIASVTSSAASTAAADATTKANAALASALAADSDTTYSVQDGQLSEINFTSADHSKLNGIAASATNVTNNNQLTNGAGYITGYTDTNTTYTAGNGMTLSGTSFLMSGSYTGSFTATGDITAYSDDSLKTNVQVIDGALGKVEAIRGVTFERIEDGSVSTGVIAQELKAVLPEAVHTDAEGIHSVAYGNITGLLIEAVKELSAQVAELKAK